ncbi:MAG TPA: alpha-hydroxy acid oxidase [Polyangiales bacterium]|nr:alpha-hydroxy acid oxidase [Polyangiales bacterium]
MGTDFVFLNLADLEQLASKRLSQAAWDYYASGADDELTLRRNREAYQELSLHYRVLVDVSKRNLETTLLGHKVSMPIAVAPTAFHRLAHPDGELASVRAAGDAKTLFILSTLSNTRVEAVAEAARGPLWFQLYVYKDREATRELVRRVEAAGCTALVVTVDAPMLGRRERDVRNSFALPSEFRVENLSATAYASVSRVSGESGLANYFAQMLDPSLTFRDLEWLRSISKLPIVVKGVVRADDAKRAVDSGASAIVVSNHGGRQLDTSPATISVLPKVVAAVGGKAEVYVDGGVRRGTDVIKALALGARAVLIGRPVLWGLTVAGRDGVAAVLESLRRELDLAMALCGCPNLAEVTPDLLEP